ncbi:hypothetical protein [Massilia sp. TS11]|uniref:hypothetical protein n=1 Tax=Massilia sp. TS11 TaxID=2908003 RepID=UPI001EDA5C5E|nr:hypothetical protein [Massilia sp. TS11]MCG2583840.1 hypothetical protein [Massilia sp. TS11]
MNSIIESPFFLPPHKDESGGVDYLGLRAINLQMMDQLLPGLNNVANRIRPFSLLTWTIWAYEDYQKERNSHLEARQYLKFREKIEALFVLSHRFAGIPLTGIAGAQQRIETRKKTTLRFEDLGRQSRNTLIEAVNYGPGLKGDGGYHFAYPHPAVPKAFLVTKVGERLAKAFDERLRKKLTESQYEFLRSPDHFTLPTDEVVAFASAWHLEKPSSKEQMEFFSRFYPSNDSGSREQTRVATIDLILSVLEHSREPLSAHEIRLSMTMGDLPPLPRAVEDARWRWKALQLRQAQRLALEVLFGWMERCIWQEDMHTTSQYASRMTEAVRQVRPDWNVETVLAGRLTYFAAMGDTSEALFSHGWTHPECNVVGAAVELVKAARGLTLDDEVVVSALDLLILVAVHTEHFLRSPTLAPYVINASYQRLPLQWWATTLRAHGGESLQTFLQRLIETWLVSQHLGVAASRSTDDSGRMRLSIDDAGISSLLQGENECWSPTLTADRVVTALSLLHECGKIECYSPEEDETRYFVTRL